MICENTHILRPYFSFIAYHTLLSVPCLLLFPLVHGELELQGTVRCLNLSLFHHLDLMPGRMQGIFVERSGPSSRPALPPGCLERDCGASRRYCHIPGPADSQRGGECAAYSFHFKRLHPHWHLVTNHQIFEHSSEGSPNVLYRSSERGMCSTLPLFASNLV